MAARLLNNADEIRILLDSELGNIPDKISFIAYGKIIGESVKNPYIEAAEVSRIDRNLNHFPNQLELRLAPR